MPFLISALGLLVLAIIILAYKYNKKSVFESIPRKEEETIASSNEQMQAW